MNDGEKEKLTVVGDLNPYWVALESAFSDVLVQFGYFSLWFENNDKFISEALKWFQIFYPVQPIADTFAEFVL